MQRTDGDFYFQHDFGKVCQTNLQELTKESVSWEAQKGQKQIQHKSHQGRFCTHYIRREHGLAESRGVLTEKIQQELYKSRNATRHLQQ